VAWAAVEDRAVFAAGVWLDLVVVDEERFLIANRQ
jgi:hypothetical protein